MFDHHHGVPGLDQPVEHPEEAGDVVEMQAGGGLVQDVERVPGGPLRELARELDPLRFPARQGRRGLPKPDVAEPDVLKRLEDVQDAGLGAEHGDGLAHREVEHVGDGAALVAHRQRLVVEPASVAHLAGDEDVRQEVHLHPDHPVALAVLAPPARHVEGEASRLVTLGAGGGERGEERTNPVEHLRVGRRVGTRGAADGGLVNVHHPSDPFDPLDVRMPPDGTFRAVQRAGERPVEHLVHQRALPGARDSGDAGERAERKRNVHFLQVVRPRPHDPDRMPGGAPPRGYRDVEVAAEIAPRERFRLVADLRRGSFGDHLPAVHPGARTEVQHVVRGLDGLPVVLDHHDGIADVPQPMEGLQQLPVVARMKPDGGLVKDVDDPGEFGADLAGQPDALRFPSGQARRQPVEREVAEPHVGEEAEPVPDLLQQLRPDDERRPLEFEVGHEVERVLDGHRGNGRDGLVAHDHGERLRPQPGPPARPAGPAREIPRVIAPRPVGGRLPHPAGQQVEDALPLHLPGAPVVPDPDSLPAGALEQDVPLAGREPRPRPVEVHRETLRDRPDHRRLPSLALGEPSPRPHRALVDAQPRVRDHQLLVHLAPGAQPVALLAHPLRAVEGKELRRDLGEPDAAARAAVLLREDAVAVLPLDRRDHDAVPFAKRGLHRVGDPAPPLLAG